MIIDPVETARLIEGWRARAKERHEMAEHEADGRAANLMHNGADIFTHCADALAKLCHLDRMDQ